RRGAALQQAFESAQHLDTLRVVDADECRQLVVETAVELRRVGRAVEAVLIHARETHAPGTRRHHVADVALDAHPSFEARGEFAPLLLPAQHLLELVEGGAVGR
ncbi:MAG: hypothetical protein ACK559_26620, partial [bacterium]